MKRHLLLGSISATLALAFGLSTPSAQEAKPAKEEAKPVKEKAKPAKAKAVKPKAPTKVKFAGKILGVDGKPVEGATVSGYFKKIDGIESASYSTKSDAKGEFTTELRVRANGSIFYVKDGKGHGAIVKVPKTSKTDLVVNLLPERKFAFDVNHFSPKVMAEVAAAKKSSEAPKETPSGDEVKPKTHVWTPSLRVYTINKKTGNPQSPSFLFHRTQFAKAELSLVPGEYAFYIFGSGCKSSYFRRTIEAGEGVQQLEKATLKPNVVNEGLNKPALAISPTHVRKLGKEIKAGAMLSLEDYKGKWVILEFWGFW